MKLRFPVSERVFQGDVHTTSYLCAGPDDGPLLIFVHGWPELSLSWRHQLPVLAGLGYRCVAPDMRGYGGSSVYARHEDYALERSVQDMLALLDHLQCDKAVWIGHDWGSPVVWSIASHHPERVHALASLCVPYRTLDAGLDATLALANRTLYPEDQFPAAQWEYMRFYEEHFDKATAAFEANPYNTVKLLFRSGNPDGQGKPAATAFTRINDGWFPDGGGAPDFPLDEAVVSEDELRVYARHLERNGFFGPDSWYMNHARNAAYGAQVGDQPLNVPVLFLAARYDYVCDAVNSDLAQPMRRLCSNLREEIVDSGHWMAQEKPVVVNRHLASWLLATV